MAKNITVTDTYGNIIGATYPKRAKGLVKNGRAIFVDGCTIRLSEKSVPSDSIISSEVKQMNYILLNPRNWSFEQTQYHNQNNFAFSGRTSANAQRTFINDFDGNLIESLMFGSWNNAPVSAVSAEQSLTPDTDYSFVFWLNGGENDRGDEVCQLQIVFFGNHGDCYTYNLSRNYIKPLLHKAGWELYSIPFCTPAALSHTSVSSPVAENGVLIPTRFIFLANNAPMAVKPAKEPDAYADWTDEPDEFADQRPQRHNIVFTDGWPARYQYGGDKYSTEVLRNKKNAFATAAAMANQNNSSSPSETPIHEAFTTLSDDYAEDLADFTEQLEDLEEQRDDLINQREDLQELFEELNDRASDVLSNNSLSLEESSTLTGMFDAFQAELTSLDEQIHSSDARLNSAAKNLAQTIQATGSIEQCEGFLDSLENSLDMAENLADSMEDTLDSIEEYLDSVEDRHEA